MRDTPYATQLNVVQDEVGQSIERLYVKEHAREEIRFSWWRDGRMMVRPLDLPEDELLALLNDAFDKDIFSDTFLAGLHSALSSHLDRRRYRSSLERLHDSRSGGDASDERRRTRGLIEYLRRAKPIDEDWPEIDDPPPRPVDL